MKKFFAIAALALLSLTAGAQTKLNYSVGLESSHLWRGYEVSNGVNTTAQLALQAGGFQIGLWNGMTITSQSYREFDYFMSYSAGGFSVSLWDIYNYSPGNARFGHTEDQWMNIFNYNKYSTGHILDLGVAYNFGESFPLNLSWNTIIQGRDLDAVDNDTQAYSTYVQVGYTVYKDEHWTVTPSVGGSFKFAGDADANFYSNSKAGINDVRLTSTYNLKVGKNFTMPISAIAMWNPNAKRGYMAATVTLVNL